MPLASSFVSPPLGFSIPYLTPHAVSVSLPTWRDNVGYEEGEKRVVEAMQTGYPRFFVHRSIQKLAGIANGVLADDVKNDKCYLYPTEKIAKAAVAFLQSRTEPALSAPAYYKPWHISAEEDSPQEDSTTIYAVFMKEADFGLGKQYWQHTGDGISSRLAEHCLHLLGETPVGPKPTVSTPTSLQQMSTGQRDNPNVSSAPIRGGFSRNKHYSKKSSAALEAIIASSTPSTPSAAEEVPEPQTSTSKAGANGSQAYKEDLSTYIEERYARNLALSQAPQAKTAMKRRIAGVLKESPSSSISPAVAHTDDIIEEFTTAPSSDTLQNSTRGVTGLTEDEVYLYPTGMSAIFHAFLTVLKAAELSGTKQVGKSVCFGFPYTDTLKILQKWGPGCHFFGKGLDSDLDDLEELLRSRQQRFEQNPDSTDPDDKPILSLFCEFPSNPLLRSPNLQRIRRLADKYGFAVCVDETVGGFVNVECLPHADIVMSSLTKVFSGDSNVMGGSLTLNPNLPKYKLLKQALEHEYEDTYFSPDAIFMERNSRDFRTRVVRINQNANAICSFLHAHTSSPHTASGRVALSKVYYPKFITSHNYSACARTAPEAGFGGLFSVTFTSIAASKAFFDTLECCKGPSLGTNFTLACPYTVLAHYLELEWAAEFEVEEGLVRVSVGLEDEKTLLEWFSRALTAAEEA